MYLLQVQLLSCLMCFFICQKSIGNCAPRTCPAGQMIEYNSQKCVPCPSYGFQTKPNPETFCEHCRTCDEETGSMLLSKCTTTSNAKCKCREGFVAREEDNSSCRCDRGSALNATEKKCLRCPNGYFNPEAGKECRPWTDCGTRGVRIDGSHESDVVCHDDSETNRPYATKDPVSMPVTVATTPPVTTFPSPSITPTTSTSISPSLSLSTTIPPVESSGFLGFAIAIPPLIILILLCPIICKKIISPFMRNYKKKADTPCRKPIEESGESSRSSLVKSCQGQP
ncbi:hypothetical protein GJAV_G00178250 [Gymnothorax javanicus]|nr:hypothetical protein GJAV_G00178250 [Gymnothorax javanicus]